MAEVKHIRVRVFPGARKAKVEHAENGEMIMVHVVAAAASGAANKEMLQLIRQYLQTDKQIRIVSGHRQPQKIIAITN